MPESNWIEGKYENERRLSKEAARLWEEFCDALEGTVASFMEHRERTDGVRAHHTPQERYSVFQSVLLHAEPNERDWQDIRLGFNFHPEIPDIGLEQLKDGKLRKGVIRIGMVERVVEFTYSGKSHSTGDGLAKAILKPYLLPNAT